MKKFFNNHQQAVSTIEYVVLVVLFLTAIVVMQKPIARAFFGRWKDLGDSIGQGEQYDPNATTACGRYVEYHPDTNTWGQEIWYLEKCYECCFDITMNACPNFHGGSLSSCRQGTAFAQKDCCAKGCTSTTGQCNF